MSSFYKAAINEESGNLLDYDERYSNLFKDEVGAQKIKESLLKKFSKSSFLFKFFIFIFLLSIILSCIYTIAFLSHKPNFRINHIKWDTSDLDDRKYENYIFDNGLEVMIIQDPNFNRDGGSIVIESGYMDNPYNEGIDTFATNLLSHIIFPNANNISNLKDYYGHYDFDCGRYLTTYVFDILNSGFTKFLSDFSLILNSNISENFDTYFENYEKEIISELNSVYSTQNRNVDFRELHLIEYFVFGLKNENGKEICPKGNSVSLGKYTNTELKSKVKEYIEQLIDPKKIKIVLFSRYKTSISSKYMKNYFKFLTSMEKPKKLNKNEFVIKEFKTSQMFLLYADYYDINYIDIYYYIDKINSESYSELFYKSSYLNYIIDFLKEKKEGSLYYLLTNNSNHNVRDIYAGYEIVFKSKIEFFIYIQLNSLKNINNVIYLTYQFINKIVKQAIGNNTQFDRYIELKNQYYQDLKYSEKPYDTIKLAKDNADAMIQKKFAQKYFFYNKYIPWNDTINYNDNLGIIKNETYHYLKQLKPEKSVIVLSLRSNNLKDLTCNATSPFYLDCEELKNNDFKKSYYYATSFKNYIFNSSFEKNLDKDDNADITFHKNNFTSKHNGTYINQEEKEQEIEILSNKTYNYSKFYFKRNINLKIPKVFITLYFLHPFLRPMNKDEIAKKCYYFQIMQLFSGIKHKINEALADAFRSGNQISFSENENNLVIYIYCYEDVAYEIMKTIKNITFDTKWDSIDSDYYNEIYKNEALDDYFNLNTNNLELIALYYLLCKLKNNVFNKYEFFPDEFNNKNCTSYIKDVTFKQLTSFIINGYIYGYYTKENAQKIYDLFETNYEDTDIKANLITVENSEIQPSEFINWISQVKELNETDKIYINPKIFNTKKYGNYFVCYVKSNSSVLDIYMFHNILSKIQLENFLFYYNLVIIGDLYFELVFYVPKNYPDFSYDDLIEIEWNSILDKFSEFDDSVDNIGNRYYYVKKNLISTFIERQTSLSLKAQYEMREYFHDGLSIDPKKIVDEYYERYEDYQELDELTKEFRNILEKKRYLVYTVGE